MDDKVEFVGTGRKCSFAGTSGDAPLVSKLAQTSQASLRVSRSGSAPVFSPHFASGISLPPSISPSTSQGSQFNPCTGLVLSRLATLEASVDRSHAEFKERIREIQDLCDGK